jgi:hypothetical protein
VTEPIEQETVVVPKGDPVYSVWIWRQDSITLMRLRPTLELMVTLSQAPCENLWGSTCLDDAGRGFDTGEGATSYCWPCRLRVLVQRMNGVIR